MDAKNQYVLSFSFSFSKFDRSNLDQLRTGRGHHEGEADLLAWSVVVSLNIASTLELRLTAAPSSIRGRCNYWLNSKPWKSKLDIKVIWVWLDWQRMCQHNNFRVAPSPFIGLMVDVLVQLFQEKGAILSCWLQCALHLYQVVLFFFITEKDIW